MYYWSPYPFVRIAIFLALGIFVGYKFQWESIPVDGNWVAFLLLLPTLVTFILFQSFRKRWLQVVLGTTQLVTVAALGIFWIQEYQYNNNRLYFDSMYQTVTAYGGRIAQAPELRGQNQRVILKMDWAQLEEEVKPTTAWVLLYVKYDSSSMLSMGDELWISGNPQAIQSPANPGSFDFKRYWAIKNIHLNDFVDHKELVVVGHTSPGLIASTALSCRRWVSGVFREVVSDDQIRAVLLALVLGEKSELDPEIKSAYAAAGAMHILAVSGLHVGIIYLFLTTLLGKLKRLKSGSYLVEIIALVALWSYALITGLSPSVMRAVMMFTFYILGRLLARQRNIYNSLGVAAFALLLYDPLMLFSVGFQLSFVAVAGIVFLQPKIYRLYEPNGVFINWVWQLTSVSIAAQFITGPIAVYYFHQLPTLALLTNLIVIPGALIVLVGGLLVLVGYALFSWLGEILGWLLEWVIWALNKVIFFVEGISWSVIENLSLEPAQVILLYLALLSCFWLFQHKKFGYVLLAVLAIGCFTVVDLIQIQSRSQNAQLIVYHQKKTTVIELRNGKESRIFTEDDFNLESNLARFTIQPSLLQAGFTMESARLDTFGALSDDRLGNKLITWKGKRVIILRQVANWIPVEKIKVDVMVVTGNAVPALEEISAIFDFEYLIADGSNYGYPLHRLEQEGKVLEDQFHSTRKQGAFIWSLKD